MLASATLVAQSAKDKFIKKSFQILFCNFLQYFFFFSSPFEGVVADTDDLEELFDIVGPQLVDNGLKEPAAKDLCSRLLTAKTGVPFLSASATVVYTTVLHVLCIPLYLHFYPRYNPIESFADRCCLINGRNKIEWDNQRLFYSPSVTLPLTRAA